MSVNCDRPRNRPVSVDVSLAARQWLQLRDLQRIDANGQREAQLHRPTWMSLWRPYWLIKRRIPRWLPLQPSMTRPVGTRTN